VVDARLKPFLAALVVALSGGMQAARAAEVGQLSLEGKGKSYVLKMQNRGQGTITVAEGRTVLKKLVQARDSVSLPAGRTYQISIEPATADSWRTLDLSVAGDASGMGFGSFMLTGPCRFNRETVLSDWDKFFVVKAKEITVKVKK